MSEYAKKLAQHDYAKGLGHEANPFKDKEEREAYMLEMGRLHDKEFRELNLEIQEACNGY